MTLYVVIHNHKYGNNTHLIQAKTKPPVSWLKEAILEDYNERDGDSVEVYGHSQATSYPENKTVELF
jgi:hypothetical protein